MQGSAHVALRIRRGAREVGHGVDLEQPRPERVIEQHIEAEHLELVDATPTVPRPVCAPAHLHAHAITHAHARTHARTRTHMRTRTHAHAHAHAHARARTRVSASTNFLYRHMHTHGRACKSAHACARFQCTCMRTLSGTRALEDSLGPTRRAPAEIARYTSAHMRRQADLTASSPRSARSCKRQRKGVCAHARKPRVRMHRASAHTHAPGRAAPREAGSCEPEYSGSTPAPDRSNSTTRTPSPRSSSQAPPSQLS